MHEHTCPQCLQPFTPRDQRQQLCSRACRNAKARQRLAELRAQGHDPAHGGKAAEARRQSLAKRRAAGELLGRAAAKAKREGKPTKRESGTTTAKHQTHSEPQPVPPEAAAHAYLKRGQTYEQRIQRALRKDASTLIVAGYGASIRVERDALIVKEGHTHNPQTPLTHVLYKGIHAVVRIVCLDCKGGVSFDAIRWCVSQGIAISLLDRNGSLISELTPEADGNVQLRRQQYGLGTYQTSGIAAQLVLAKLDAQVATLAAHPELPSASHGHAMLIAHIQDLERLYPRHIITLDTLRLVEGRAAAAYFDAWKGVPLKWKTSDRCKIPPHWLYVRERFSPLAGQRNRHAVDPTNAMLNYAYGMLEGQCRTALAAQGFDVACGILHADKQSRDSLVYDLMEPLRPVVDGLVLGVLSKTTFTYGDFIRGNDGACRLHPQLARYIVATCRVSDHAVREEARRLRDALLDTTRMEWLPA